MNQVHRDERCQKVVHVASYDKYDSQADISGRTSSTLAFPNRLMTAIKEGSIQRYGAPQRWSVRTRECLHFRLHSVAPAVTRILDVELGAADGEPRRPSS